MTYVTQVLATLIAALTVTIVALIQVLIRKHAGRWDCMMITKPKDLEPTYPWQTVEFNASASIPFHLWQTYATDQIPKQAAEAVQSWKTMNPDMPITFHDDEMADAFILENFGNEIYDIYKSFPVGAMRSDFWRYAVIYMKGGIYGDIDTSCQRPVAEWLPAAKPAEWENYEPEKWYSVGGMALMNLTWSDCSIVIAREPTGWFCQWAFAGVAGHPMLRRVLELIIQRAKDGIDVSNGHFVHFHTGPAAWTDAIRSYLGYDYKERWPGADVVIKEVWSNPIMYRLARSVGICLMDWWFYDGDTSETRVRHLFASQKFDKSEYTSWLTEAGAAHG